MDKISVADARRVEAIGRTVLLRGWVRTRRDSKGGFSFIELNDGSCQGNVQIVAPGDLANYESEIKKLLVGASVAVEGEVKASPAKGQPTEVQAAKVEVFGHADAETYPIQKKGATFEFLRTVAHLRPRTNTFGAIARLRNQICKSIANGIESKVRTLVREVIAALCRRPAIGVRAAPHPADARQCAGPHANLVASLDPGNAGRDLVSGVAGAAPSCADVRRCVCVKKVRSRNLGKHGLGGSFSRNYDGAWRKTVQRLGAHTGHETHLP